MKKELNGKSLKDILSTEEFYNWWFDGTPWPEWKDLTPWAKEAWRTLFILRRREIVKN